MKIKTFNKNIQIHSVEDILRARGIEKVEI
jgi:hypothetical protein